MVEKCLVIATLAILVCHPRTTIKCFKPKPSTTISPHRERPLSQKSSHPRARKQPSKSKKERHPMLKNDKANNMASELDKGDPLIGIMETIFHSGWSNKVRFKIEKVLKVNHSIDALSKFEEHRKIVKSKSPKASSSGKNEKVAADGNEVLMFHGAILTCSLGRNKVSSTCKEDCCGVCRMITRGFPSGKGYLSFYQNSWEAHDKVTIDCVTNEVSVRKAMIVCRVTAGQYEDGSMIGEGHYDSLVGSSRNGSTYLDEHVLNPRAVLPCFVVIYNVV